RQLPTWVPHLARSRPTARWRRAAAVARARPSRPPRRMPAVAAVVAAVVPPAQQPEPAAPDVSGQDPQAAMASVGTLPAAQMPTALGGVDASVGRSVGQDRTALAAAPPTMNR